MPDKIAFSTQLDIRIDDVNYGGHLSNDRVLSMVHEVRLRFFQSMGYSELDLAGVSTIMADTAIVYQSEGFQGDEINVDVAITDFTRVGFDLFYQLNNLTTGKALAIVKTGIICFDYETRKVCEVPDALKIKIDA